MKVLSTLTAVVFLLVGVQQGLAQAKEIQYDVSESQAILLGKTKPVYDLILRGEVSNEKRMKWKKDRKTPNNFIGRRGESKAIYPDLEHQGEDKLWQKEVNPTRQDPTVPIVNMDGLFDGSGSPYDPTGDVGMNYYIQAVNATRIGIYEKDGNFVTSITGNSLWADLGAASLGDPIILYDQAAQRWMITEFTGPTDMLIAISETEDPLGSYYTYRFSAPNFPDYPKYGIWKDIYAITTNEQGPGTLHQYFLDRDALLSGAATVPFQRVAIQGNGNTEAGFYTSTPVDWNGLLEPLDDRPIVLALNDSSWGSATQDVLRFIRFDVDFDNANNTVVEEIEIPLSPFDGYPCASEGIGFACIPQPNGNGLDGIPEVVMNAPYYRRFESHEAIVLNFITDVTDGDNISGIRWVELRRTSEMDWHVYQEGTFAPDDGLHRFMGAIAMDKNGNIGLAYNVSGESEQVGIRYTGRRASDELGQMTVPETEVVSGQSTINSGGRFGDYSQMSVDPSNDNTFWFTSEYAGPGNTRTRIFSFELARDTFDLAAIAIRQPVDSDMLTAAEQVQVDYTNTGLEAIEEFTVSIGVNGTPLEEVVVSQTINPGDSYTHTFAQAVDMSAYGDYQIIASISADEDQNTFNNTITRTVQHLATDDVSISANISEEICIGGEDLIVTVRNEGFETLTGFTLAITNNGSPILTDEYTVNLGSGEDTDLTIFIEEFDGGANTIEVVASMPNGQVDLRPMGNTATATTTLDPDAIKLTLELLTDDYPDEITWQVFDPTTFQVIYSGGPYEDENTTYTTSMCLSKTQCYIFIALDSYGDGFCCGANGNGSYNIVDDEGNVVLFGLGEFGSSLQVEFCPGVLDCDLNVSILASDAVSGGDGSIMVMASNGEGPFMYSIDGGATFQTNALFSGLSAGDYAVVVVDASGVCQYEETVTVEGTSHTEDILTEAKILVSPNPSDGLFTVQIGSDNISALTMYMDIFDVNGQRIQSRLITKYNNIFQGTVSLVDYPDGSYYLAVNNAEFKAMSLLIKQ